MAAILEVCVDSVESAVHAEKGGATRLELCADLIIGGTSPDEDLFLMVRERVNIPIRVLLRPRFGDFLYSADEFELLRRQVKRFAGLGADGVVIGVLQPDGMLDEQRMAELIALAGGCGVTLHRAFDVCRDPFATLAAAKELGVDTILTSGQKACCADPGGSGGQCRGNPRAAACDMRRCVPFVCQAGGKQPDVVPARGSADGAARYQ